MNLKIQKIAFSAVLFSFATMSFSSCATIFGRTSYPVSISTSPSDAAITITDRSGKEIYKGVSPATLKLASSAGYMKRAEYQVRIKSPGYAEQILPISAHLNGWYIGNILIGGVIGMLIVDPASGAMYKLDNPSNINVHLLKEDHTASLEIKDINDVPTADFKKLVRIN